MTFRVGQKVVCIDAAVDPKYRSPPWNSPTGLVEGSVYTIRGTECRAGILGVYLEEVKSGMPDFLDGGERSFRPSRFRPIVERPTDISIFTAMLTSQKERA